MQRARRAGLVDVAVREVIWMWRDKVALLVAVGIPLVAFALLAATFGNAVIRDLRVDVVDLLAVTDEFRQAISAGWEELEVG